MKTYKEINGVFNRRETTPVYREEEEEVCEDGGDGGCETPSCSSYAGQNTIYVTADGSVYYNADEAVGGFQFVLEGATFSGAAGGAAQDAGFVVQGGGTTVLGFSFTGSTFGFSGSASNSFFFLSQDLK